MQRISWICLDCDYETIRYEQRKVLKHCPKCDSQDIVERDTCASCFQRLAPDTGYFTQSGKSYTFQFGEWKLDEEIEQDRKDNPEFYKEIEEGVAREEDLKRKIDLVMEYDGGETALHRALDNVIKRLEGDR